MPAIAVDTHVFRVTNRLGLADAKDVRNEKTAYAGDYQRTSGLGRTTGLYGRQARVLCKKAGLRRVLSCRRLQIREGKIVMFVDKVKIS